MDNYQKFGWISGQALAGLVFGLGGAIVTAILETVYEQFTGRHSMDLFGSILSFLLGGYIGMQIGIGYVGYKLLTHQGRPRQFIRFFGQSIAGLVLGLLIFYNLIRFYNVYYFAVFLPMILAVVGFDIGVFKTNEKTS